MRTSQLFAMRPLSAVASLGPQHNCPRKVHARPLSPVALGALVVAILAIVCPAALAAAPLPCGGAPQISDDKGDGHHANTDVLAAWLSEQAGRLQAVIQVDLADWGPAHEDSEAAGWALLFGTGVVTHYVRVEGSRTAAPRLDFGTWTPAGGFVSAGPTTGELTTGFNASVTIDVPAGIGADPGARLTQPFVLTYDGTEAGAPHWVDRAPGGVTPSEAAFGADYVVGSCQPGMPGAPGSGGENPGGGGTGGATSALVLNAPRRLVGAGRVRASGRVLPARGSVSVRVTARPRNSRAAAVVRTVMTLTDGSFGTSLPLNESSSITAVAEGINAQTRVVTVQSTVRMTLRRARGGRTAISGRVSPRLAGRILLLRTNAVAPSATTTARLGRFTFRSKRLAPGRYQAVFIPSGNRAERSTSKTGVVR